MPHGPQPTFDIGVTIRIVQTKRARITGARWRATVRKDQG